MKDAWFYRLLKMKINSIPQINNLWETDDCSLQRQSLEEENISTSAVRPAKYPSMADSHSIPYTSRLRWNKNEGRLHHQAHMFPTAFYYLGLQIQPGYRKRTPAFK